MRSEEWGGGGGGPVQIALLNLGAKTGEGRHTQKSVRVPFSGVFARTCRPFCCTPNCNGRLGCGHSRNCDNESTRLIPKPPNFFLARLLLFAISNFCNADKAVFWIDFSHYTTTIYFFFWPGIELPNINTHSILPGIAKTFSSSPPPPVL